jgi:hypothetical protein
MADKSNKLYINVNSIVNPATDSFENRADKLFISCKGAMDCIKGLILISIPFKNLMGSALIICIGNKMIKEIMIVKFDLNFIVKILIKVIIITL